MIARICETQEDRGYAHGFESMRLAIERRPALVFPLSHSLDEALRRLMALAGALLGVFGLVVVALEAFQDLSDARFPFFSLRS